MTQRKPRQRLIDWMKQYRFTPSNLAEALDINSPSTIWEWCHNGRKPHPKTLKKFDELIASVCFEPFPAKDLFDDE